MISSSAPCTRALKSDFIASSVAGASSDFRSFLSPIFGLSVADWTAWLGAAATSVVDCVFETDSATDSAVSVAVTVFAAVVVFIVFVVVAVAVVFVVAEGGS
jgi:hypothetical protein